ncbi:MAG: hypothetical protein ABSE62_05060 [Chthoniobacteraceae bacterium]|jgi:hypothetical protein
MKRATYILFCLCTAVIGFHIHHSIFWAWMDFCFGVLTWLKWLILQQVNLTIIKGAFAFFWR